ncbi:saccharopine dehydrogenase family protein [Paenibacillus sinopodophylli]|uniref:saccharopine dehydrogenase family protein n=1 Tax=Paenibacillus sinopodophylli TaxID=1837342 RepID=UPI00110CA009|nr:saccharopine dehydrogenase NADP-binding domain-containing protein [Paenibacillus sinopodophylli]
MKTDIIVVGGYGHVGGQICKLLADSYPGHIYAAGRNIERAELFCRAVGGRVKPLRLDVGKPIPKQLLERAKVVIMCLDQTATDFAMACLKEGIAYIDVSANGLFFEAMEQLKKQDVTLKGTALLSVGLAPGLTNLLSLKAVQALDTAERIEIGIMLGLGDAHGKAAIEWTVDSLTQSFSITEHHRLRKVSSFDEGKKADFGGSWGNRTAYRFPFSDQQTLPTTLGVPSISTRLCFDSRFVTKTIAVLQRLGFMRLLRIGWIRELAIQSFGKLRIGSEGYAVKIAGYGKQGEMDTIVEFGLQGEKEADITAGVAAAAAMAMYESELPKGIFHVEQLFELNLHEQGIALRLKGNEDAWDVSTVNPIQSWSRTRT